MKNIATPLVLIAGLVVSFGPVRAAGRSAQPAGQGASVLEVSVSAHHAVSAPLRDIPSAPRARTLTERPLRSAPGSQAGPLAPDGALQQFSATTNAAVSSVLNFPGVGAGNYGFSPNAAPPDTNGAVGATQYVQWVNESFAVFDKATGAIAAGFPKAGNTLWRGFGGGCETNNDGDPIAQYDKLANRWVLTQFSVSTTPYLQCVAVSTTSDATGSYNLYSFNYGTQFPDYPKLGVWPDAYYVTYNIFNNGSTFAGPKVCAWDRTAMLAGAAATQVCFQLGTSVNSLLPSDLDGTNPPPAGAPNLLARISPSSSLQLWRFHVDFRTPGNSTLSGPSTLAVASYSEACGGGTCVPQVNTRQQLDSLADRAMHRFAYRNLGTTDSWLLNHSVATSIVHNRANGSGIRWYELRGDVLAGVPTVYQQDTFAPDSSFRWMGSIAQDKVGNIAVGYSVSSGSMHPAIRVASRAASDPLSQLTDETSIIEGTGSQLRNLSRWGDYSAMTVDPVNDCTFWYTNEYLKADGTFNWSTRIASFTLPGCF
jgi:hypothetical protein